MPSATYSYDAGTDSYFVTGGCGDAIMTIADTYNDLSHGPRAVTRINASAFLSCTSLVTLILGNNIKTIGASAFYNCTNITSVTIPNSVTSIGVSAFENCTSLTSITIPKSVTIIDNTVFAFCSSLIRVNFLGNAPTLGSFVFKDTNVNFKIYRYSTKSGWSSFFDDIDVLLIDSPINKNLQTFGFPKVSSGKISIKKRNTDGGKLRTYKNFILNSRFDADNQYPIYDGSYFFDNNYNREGNCSYSPACTILTNYQHNSPLFYNPTLSQYNTFANRTFHEINAPYNVLPIGHPIQPRLLKMFGVGSFFGRRYEYNWGYPDRADGESNFYRTITSVNYYPLPSDSESWVKYGVEQTVQIPSWATKVVYGVKYLAKSDDLFRTNNFAGLKLNFRKYSYYRNYVNIHLIRRSATDAVDALESAYGSNVYTYFNSDFGSNATSQWLGPNTSIVKVRKRSSTIIDSNTDQFIKIEDTIDIPTFSTSGGQPDYADGRPEEVSLEMFFAEWVNYFVDSGPNGNSSGSIYFYEPFIYFV